MASCICSRLVFFFALSLTSFNVNEAARSLLGSILSTPSTSLEIVLAPTSSPIILLSNAPQTNKLSLLPKTLHTPTPSTQPCLPTSSSLPVGDTTKTQPPLQSTSGLLSSRMPSRLLDKASSPSPTHQPSLGNVGTFPSAPGKSFSNLPAATTQPSSAAGSTMPLSLPKSLAAAPTTQPSLPIGSTLPSGDGTKFLGTSPTPQPSLPIGKSLTVGNSMPLSSSSPTSQPSLPIGKSLTVGNSMPLSSSSPTSPPSLPIGNSLTVGNSMPLSSSSPTSQPSFFATGKIPLLPSTTKAPPCC